MEVILGGNTIVVHRVTTRGKSGLMFTTFIIIMFGDGLEKTSRGAGIACW